MTKDQLMDIYSKNGVRGLILEGVLSGRGASYDDTQIKSRVKATEEKNTVQDQAIQNLDQEMIQSDQTIQSIISKNTDQDQQITTIIQKNVAQDQSINQLTTAIQVVNQKNDSQDLILTALTRYDSQMVVPWGDSRSAQNWNTNTNPAAVLARSWLWWFELLSQRVRVNVDYMQGVSGDKMSDLLTRIQNDTVPTGGFGTKKPSEVPPCIAAVMCWTNSVNAGVPLDTLVSQTNQVLDYLLSKGHKVMLIAEWPRGASGSTDGSLTADNQKLLLATHNALLKIRRKDVFIVDVWPRVADPASVNAYPLPNMLNPDNLHNSPGIAMITGQEMTRVAIEEMKLPRLKMTTSSNTDQYDLNLQPQGCLNTNPMLITSGGTLGANATGSAPLGYTLSASAGLSVAGSFVTTVLPDGSKRKAFRMVITGTPTSANGYASLRQSGILSKVSVNDILESHYEVFVADGHSNFGSPGIMIDTGLASTRAHGGLSLTGDNIVPTEAVRSFYGVPRSADLNIGSTLPASISFEMRAYTTVANVAASLTMDILSSGLRKKKQ